jgi:hypothetical protein
VSDWSGIRCYGCTVPATATSIAMEALTKHKHVFKKVLLLLKPRDVSRLQLTCTWLRGACLLSGVWSIFLEAETTAGVQPRLSPWASFLRYNRLAGLCVANGSVPQARQLSTPAGLELRDLHESLLLGNYGGALVVAPATTPRAQPHEVLLPESVDFALFMSPTAVLAVTGEMCSGRDRFLVALSIQGAELSRLPLPLVPHITACAYEDTARRFVYAEGVSVHMYQVDELTSQLRFVCTFRPPEDEQDCSGFCGTRYDYTYHVTINREYVCIGGDAGMLRGWHLETGRFFSTGIGRWSEWDRNSIKGLQMDGSNRVWAVTCNVSGGAMNDEWIGCWCFEVDSRTWTLRQRYSKERCIDCQDCHTMAVCPLPGGGVCLAMRGTLAFVRCLVRRRRGRRVDDDDEEDSLEEGAVTLVPLPDLVVEDSGTPQPHMRRILTRLAIRMLHTSDLTLAVMLAGSHDNGLLEIF